MMSCTEKILPAEIRRVNDVTIVGGGRLARALCDAILTSSGRWYELRCDSTIDVLPVGCPEGHTIIYSHGPAGDRAVAVDVAGAALAHVVFPRILRLQNPRCPIILISSTFAGGSSCYGMLKAMGERAVRDAGPWPVCALRPGTILYPDTSGNDVGTEFLRRAVSGKPLMIPEQRAEVVVAALHDVIARVRALLAVAPDAWPLIWAIGQTVTMHRLAHAVANSVAAVGLGRPPVPVRTDASLLGAAAPEIVDLLSQPLEILIGDWICQAMKKLEQGPPIAGPGDGLPAPPGLGPFGMFRP